MIERLRSHLRTQKGFTLIELLVVIAIIAVLVLIVVVAINPAERLREAADRTAAANVRSAGTLIETCITRNNGDLTACNTGPLIEAAAGGDGNVPAGVTISANATDTNVCASDEGRTGTFWLYQTAAGEVGSAAAATCP